jgi:hypothetical protein
MIIGKGDMNDSLVTGWGHLVQAFLGPTSNAHLWLSRAQIRYGHVFPSYAHA